MIYRIRQVTTYNYNSSVPFARHLLRLTPSSRPGQTVLGSQVTVDPMPYERHEAEDFFGNHVTHVSLEIAHQTMTIASTAEIRVAELPEIDPATTPPWEEVRAAAWAFPDLSARSPVHHMYASRFVPDEPAIGAYAAASFAPGRPILEAGIELMTRIEADFAYDPTATDVTTPPAEAYRLRRGVCQDFAHLMIAGLRGLGLPARYVSGYIRTVSAGSDAATRGADTSHAWVAAWCGAEAGWIEFDPTNDMIVTNQHVVVAYGRDFSDVTPVRGVILGGSTHTLSVAVSVLPMNGETTGPAGNPTS